jgi:hypothetical protein
MSDNKEGWTWLINARKWHYFKDNSRSLCGRWLKMGNPTLEQGNDKSPDNCKTCLRRLESIRAKEMTS